MEKITLEESQQAALEVMHQIAEICENNNFKYSLVYGTLLGAVRHKGFIPWDDDIDIMMPRPDYEKFLAYMEQHKKEYPYLEVFNPVTCREYPYMITRVSDNRYEIVMDNEEPYGMGMFVDVYPYDGLGKTKEEALHYGLKGDHISSFCYQATRKHYARESTVSNLRQVLKLPVFLAAKLIGKDFFQNQLKKLAAQKDYETSVYVGCVVWMTGGEKDIFKREWFDELIKLPFGPYEFLAPARYDEVLRHNFGDYMQLPPEKDRIAHHFYTPYKK